MNKIRMLAVDWFLLEAFQRYVSYGWSYAGWGVPLLRHPSKSYQRHRGEVDPIGEAMQSDFAGISSVRLSEALARMERFGLLVRRNQAGGRVDFDGIDRKTHRPPVYGDGSAPTGRTTHVLLTAKGLNLKRQTKQKNIFVCLSERAS